MQEEVFHQARASRFELRLIGLGASRPHSGPAIPSLGNPHPRTDGRPTCGTNSPACGMRGRVALSLCGQSVTDQKKWGSCARDAVCVHRRDNCADDGIDFLLAGLKSHPSQRGGNHGVLLL